MTWLARRLAPEHPVTDEDRAELDELRAEVQAQRRGAAKSARRSVVLSRYFRTVIDENHLADRLRDAMRGG